MSPLQLSNGASTVSTSRRVTTVTVIVQIPPPSTTPSWWYANQQSTQKASPVKGVSTAFIVVGLVGFLLLSVWLWWGHQANRRRKDGGGDTEKQQVVGRGDNSYQAATLWSDDEATAGISDDQATGTPNPFKETQSAPSMDQAPISTTTPPEPDPEPHPTRTDYPPNTSSSFRPRRTKVAQRQRLSSAQSDTGTISDTGAARLSSSTSSTLPPSYRTRRSSVYMPAPSDPPPFPPPAYTPPSLNPAPPSAFRMPRRARGGGRLPTARKLLQSRDDTATPAPGLESAHAHMADGMRAELTLEDGNRVEGTEEERFVASAFSDCKNGSLANDSRQANFTDTGTAADLNVSETSAGTTIRPTSD